VRVADGFASSDDFTKGQLMLRFERHAPFLCALVASLASCAAPEDALDESESNVAESAQALTISTVSPLAPDGLILSTGNLYFTHHDAFTAYVFRMAQTGGPGQEILLYAESGARFGDIVFAQVGGAFFGYFFAIEASGNVTIKRIPLTGGAATTLAVLPNNIDIVNSHRNLVTDGVNLYWQDVSSVRKMPIGGGAITVLDASSPNTPSAGIALQGNNVIYASVSDIRFVPKAGSIVSPLFRTIATASSRVTALHAVSDGVYWGEQTGAIKRKVGSTITTLSTGGLVPTSISNSSASAGGTQAWTQCGSSTCTLRIDMPSFLPDISASIASNALGVTVTPSNWVFWGDANGVRHLTF
jgi:hypothetical protein